MGRFVHITIARAGVIAALPALAGCAVVAPAVGVVGNVAAEAYESVIDYLGFGDETLVCGVPQEGEPSVVGVYLRHTLATGAHDITMAFGEPDENASAPETLTLRDADLGTLSGSGEGALVGGEEARLSRRPGFAITKTMPAVFTLEYGEEGAAAEGPLVTGLVDPSLRQPGSGLTIYTGGVELTSERITDEGISRAVFRGKYSLTAGFASGSGRFTISDLKPVQDDALPFETLTWPRLEICGPRIISSGTGQVSITSKDGKSSPPLQEGKERTPLRAQFESVMFIPADSEHPQNGHGGVFSIQSDRGSFRGVFMGREQVVNPQ